MDLIFGSHCDLLDEEVYTNVVDLAASGLIGAALAAPYCSKHSMATLKPNGPKPVRTPQALDGLPSNTALQDYQVQESTAVHDRARHILSLVAAKGGLIIIENPLTSMTWLDADMSAWVRSSAPYLAAAPACMFGTNWKKSWLFCSNRPVIHKVGLACTHDADSHLNFAGLRLPDGTFFSRLTACYPDLLANTLAQVVLPFLSQQSQVLSLGNWRQALPCEIFHQLTMHRIEDGGGLCSTAVWHVPQAPDACSRLRRAWTVRLFQTGLHKTIVDHFATGSSSAPISPSQLQPFLEDLLRALEIPSHQWEEYLRIEPGQPFRLELWKRLLQSMDDPDAPFLDELKTGVRLGVHNVIAPSPLWPLQEPSAADDQDLLQCESSWKSALDQPEVVWPLLEEECRAGFIQKVPGGLAELQRQHSHVAVGKLGLVCAENRSPRLVVDSTVSGVTANTSIPNRMLLPRISDVLQASPLVHSSRHLVAFYIGCCQGS